MVKSAMNQSAPNLLAEQNGNSRSFLPAINSPSSSPNSAEKNLNKVLIITKNDFERISGLLNKQKIDEQNLVEENNRKREMYEKSKALTRNWNNTIEGSRRLKLQKKAIKEAELENERKVVDLEHAEFMAEQRRKALEEAKLLQYNENDRVKNFHSALKLSEVLKEREKQIEMKQLIKHMNAEQEKELDEKIRIHQMEKDKNEIVSYQKKSEKYEEVTEFLKNQMKEKREKSEAEKLEKLKDAENLRMLSEQHQFERDQLDRVRMKHVKDLKQAYDQALDNKLKIHEAKKFIDEEENDEIRTYATAKKKMALLKREKEDEIQREKELKQEMIISHLGSLMKEKMSDEDLKIAKSVAKKEAQKMQDELLKQLKYQHDLNEIAKHRQETMKQKEIQRRMKEMEEKEFMKKKMETDYMFQCYEEENTRKKQMATEAVNAKNVKLVKERKEKEKKEKLADRDAMSKEIDLMRLEDDQFVDYAAQVIDYMRKHDRNVFPLQKAVYDTVYRSYPIDESNAEGAQIKKHQNDVSTRKNLGFTMN